jgi:hypothetical protein
MYLLEVNRKKLIEMCVEDAVSRQTNMIEQILIQSTPTIPDKGTIRNERPKTISDNVTVESQNTRILTVYVIISH